MTDIYLVRHAHSPFSRENEATRGLSEEGFRAAERVTDWLKHENIDVVCSSPYVRAIQTVQGVAHALQTEIDIDECFRERDLARVDYPITDHWGAIQKVFSNPYFSFPGGESNYEAEERGITAINRLLRVYEGKRVAVGTHGNIMAIIMGHFDPRFDVNFWRQLNMPDIYKLTFDQMHYVGVAKIGNLGNTD